MDFSKLSQNNKIAAGGGLVALISMFLPWFTFLDLFSFGPRGFGVFSLLVVAGGVGVLLAKVMEVADLKIANLAAEQLAMTLVGIGALLVLLRVIFSPADLSVGWGAFVGLLASAAAAAGTFLSAKDVGVAIPNAENFTSSPTDTVVGGQPGSSAPAPPAPTGSPIPPLPMQAPPTGGSPATPPPTPAAPTTPPPAPTHAPPNAASPATPPPTPAAPGTTPAKSFDPPVASTSPPPQNPPAPPTGPPVQ